MARPTPVRRQTRVGVSYQAVLTASDGHKTDAIITDLSARGFRIGFGDELLEGERVQLTVGKQGTVEAEVKWVRGREAGGVFLERVDLPQF